MTGLVVYTLVALGLGAWLPVLTLGNRRSIGAVLFGGYAIMLAGLFVLQALLGIDLRYTFWIVSAVSVAGICRLGRQYRRSCADIFLHPALVLPAAAALLIAVRGDIDYLPYAIDEFTNWIGVAKNIHLGGGYAAVREGIHLPAYTPGWRLALLLPWQIDGALAPGRSAAAAFVLHAGLIGLLFDIVRREATERLSSGARWPPIAAWLVILVYLTAQGTGALWTYILLIEQPQIYFYAGIGFLLFCIRPTEPAPANAAFHIGLAMLGGYLVKSATLALIPGMILAALWIARNREASSFRESILSALRTSLLFLGPVIAAAMLWRISLPDLAQGCLASPLATLTPTILGEALARDWSDLGARFVSAVGGFVLTYKSPVLLIAAAGLVFAVVQKRTAAVIALTTFAAVYLILLYWYHLSCFGDYYFKNLNSIERFTRVVLQPLHALGLLGVATGMFCLADRKRSRSLLDRKPVLGAALAAVVGLAALQAYQLGRTLEDVSTRRYQSIDPRIAETRAAATFVKTLKRSDAGPPLVQFISQGTDSDLLGYAKYFAADGARGQPHLLFETAEEVSWSDGEPVNLWQQRRSRQSLLQKLKSADVIWPIGTDTWIDGILQDLTQRAGTCQAPTTRLVFVKQADGRFACLAKPRLR